MREDSIFIKNIKQYFLISRGKILPETRFYCLFFINTSLGDKKKKTNFTVNSAYYFMFSLYPKCLTFD